MKLLLLVGGLAGLAVGMGSSLCQGNAWPACFCRGCLAAYLTALLLRWWGRAWRKSLEQSLEERENANNSNSILPATNTPKVSKP